MSRFALEHMKGYSWPGNVRELQNVLRSLYANASRGNLIQSGDLGADIHEGISLPSSGSLREIVHEVQREVVRRELQHSASVQAAAVALNLSESYLHRLIKKLDLCPGRAVWRRRESSGGTSRARRIGPYRVSHTPPIVQLDIRASYPELGSSKTKPKTLSRRTMSYFTIDMARAII